MSSKYYTMDFIVNDIVHISFNKEMETIEGDRYIRDAAQTKGHQAMLNGCQWHPREDNKSYRSYPDNQFCASFQKPS